MLVCPAAKRRPSASPLHLLTLLIILFAAMTAHAQVCMNINLNNPVDEYISPVYWAPGHTYTITFTDPNGEFYTTSNPTSTALYIFNSSQYVGAPTYAEDPHVTHSAPTYVSAMQTTFTVTVDSSAPTGQDGMNFTCQQTGFVGGPGFIQITPCAITQTPTITSVTPSSWTAGLATNITITGTNFIPNGNANNCRTSTLSIAAASGNISFTNMSVVSSTQITATVIPQITDPAETATVTVSNYQYNDPLNPLTATATAEITPTTCPIPHVTSISPNIWFSGKSYRNVTFTGTNFITNANATSTCPATTLTLASGDGQVTVSSVRVSSSTKMTGTVRVASYASTEAATANAYGDTAPTPDADVLGQPFIKWANDPDGSTPIIGGPYIDLSDPSAVVGEKLSLTTSPTAADLAALPVPLTFASTNPTTWTVTGGTNIGGYISVNPPTPQAPTVSSAYVTGLTLNQSTLTFYSVSSPANVSVKYTYCVSGQTTCPTAISTFSITGPSDVALTRTGQTFFITPENHEMWGIEFNATATSPENHEGAYTWVQVIQSYSEIANLEDGHQENCTGGPGLDTSYPYDTGLYAEDGPSDALSPTIETSGNNSLNFTMYLMWNPLTTGGSIAVPIASVSWTATGNVEWNSTDSTWTVLSGATSSGDVSYSPSEPTWSTAITKDSLAASCLYQTLQGTGRRLNETHDRNLAIDSSFADSLHGSAKVCPCGFDLYAYACSYERPGNQARCVGYKHFRSDCADSKSVGNRRACRGCQSG